MKLIVAILFVLVLIGVLLFLFSFPFSLGLLENLLRRRSAKMHAALRGQVATAISSFTVTLAGNVASGQVEVAGTTWNAMCKSIDGADISNGDTVEVVAGQIMWVKKLHSSD